MYLSRRGLFRALVGALVAPFIPRRKPPSSDLEWLCERYPPVEVHEAMHSVLPSDDPGPPIFDITMLPLPITTSEFWLDLDAKIVEQSRLRLRKYSDLHPGVRYLSPIEDKDER